MRISYNSPFILSYFFVALAVLILSISMGSGILSYFSVYDSSLFSLGTYFRLFSHVIGHANIQHFVGNFMIILIIGPLLEEKYGSMRLFAFTLAVALITGLVHIIFSQTALLGASGVVFSYITLSSFSNKQSNKIPFTLILVCLLYMGQEIYSALFVDDNISNTTHLLGGLIGIVGGFVMRPLKQISIY